MERPAGVTILAVLSFIGAAFLLIMSFVFIAGGAMLSRVLATGPAAHFLLGLGGAIVGGIVLALAILYLVVAIGLLKLQNWARILTIILVGLSLLSAAGRIGSFGHLFPLLIFRQLLTVVIDIWILIYLFKPHVKQAFGATSL